jgi:fructokinase
MAEKKLIVGLGEVLWDLLPERKSLGGAPANFAYIANLLGDEGIVASRVGRDQNGTQARVWLGRLGLCTDFLQTDGHHATGTAKVEVDPAGQARYDIPQPSAWDFLDWTAEWRDLAARTDAVCFGSLAQRSAKSRATIAAFLRAMPQGAVRVFDVNLRQSFWTREIIIDSLQQADIVKLNDEELPTIKALSDISEGDDWASMCRLVEKWHLKLVCVTRGSRGSLLVSKTDSDEHLGFRVKVADTIGAGDAFTAALVHEYVAGSSLGLMNEMANLVGAWVATEVGATPRPKDGAIERSLAEIG